MRELHALHFLTIAERAEDALLGGSEQAAWFTRLEDDRDNLAAAFDELCRQQDATRAARLAAALWRFWLVLGHLSEGRNTLERALGLGPLPRQLHAKTLLRAGVFSHQLRDYDRAAQLYGACTELVAPEGPSVLLADVLANRGLLAENEGRLEDAAPLLEHALRLRRDLHDHRGLPLALDNLGQLKLRTGDLAGARELVEEGCAAFRALGDMHGLSVALDNLGRIAEREGDAPDAAAAYVEQLRLSTEIGDRWRLAYALEGLGRVAAARHEAIVAVELFAAAAAARARVGDLLAAEDELRHAGIVAGLRQQVGSAIFEQAWSRGTAASVTDVAAYGLAPAG